MLVILYMYANILFVHITDSNFKWCEKTTRLLLQCYRERLLSFRNPKSAVVGNCGYIKKIWKRCHYKHIGSKNAKHEKNIQDY